MQTFSNFVKAINPLSASPVSNPPSNPDTRRGSLDFCSDDLADAHAFELGDEDEWDRVDQPPVSAASSYLPRRERSPRPVPFPSAADADSLVLNPSPPPFLFPATTAQNTTASSSHSPSQQQRVDFLAELRGDLIPSPSSSIFSFSSAKVLEDLKSSIFISCIQQSDDRRNWESWKRAAEERRSFWSMTGSNRPPVRWQLVLPSEPFPSDALPIGEEGDATASKLYVCRAYHEGSYQFGKAGMHLGKTRHTFSFASFERFFFESTFEILCSSDSSSSLPSSASIAWVPVSYLSIPNARPTVQGGRDIDGTWLGIGRVSFKGGRHPAKVKVVQELAMFGWGGKEKVVKAEREDVEVLVLV